MKEHKIKRQGRNEHTSTEYLNQTTLLSKPHQFEI